MIEKTKVLIIGAGPTGLMAACQLQMQGIDCIIIDKKSGPTKESRALILHARTLEIYDQMGLGNEALLLGKIVQKVQFIIKQKKVEEIAIGSIGEGLSPFPFLLILEQSKNEELLYNFLMTVNGDVSWNTEMLSVVQDKEKITAVVRRNEEDIDIEAEYLIAADGAGSTVRNALEIPFEGNTYEHIFYVADTKLNKEWNHDALTIYLSGQSFLGLFPMQGESRFRAIGILPPSFQNEEPKQFEEIAPLIQKQVDIPIEFSETAWFSVYRLHHRCIQNFRKDRIFFAGDAAHIHSPAGGQGMNTGLQDAYNLAWKLAMVLKGAVNAKVLDTYQQERLPFAKQLIRSTDKAFSLVTSGKWYHRLFRLRIAPLIVPFIVKMKRMKLRTFTIVTQIGIKYIQSDLTVNRVEQVLPIKAGHRFPFIKTNAGESLYEMMREPLFHALLFTKGEDEKIIKEMQEMEKELSHVMKFTLLKDETSIWKKFRLKKDTIIIVRPDHYIGLVTDEGSKVAGDYLRRLAKEKKEEVSMLVKTQTHN